MKKVSLIIVLSLTISLVGCAGKPSDTPTDAQENEEPGSMLTDDVADLVSTEGILVSTVKDFDYLTVETPETKETVCELSVDGFVVYTPGYYELEKSLQENSSNAKDNMEDFKDSIADEIEDNNISDFPVPWFYSDEVSITRSDDSVFSFYRNNRSFTGGPHDNYKKYGFTFDTKSGQALTIADIVTDVEYLKSEVIVKLSHSEDRDGYFENWTDTISESFNDLCFVLTADGLEVTIDPYIIGPYALGSVVVNLPYTEYGGSIIKSEMCNSSGQAIISLDENLTKYYDFDGDGEKEYLDIINATDEYDYAKISVNYGKDVPSANANVYTYEMGYGVSKAVIMQSVNGDYFLYVENYDDNDYRFIEVFGLSNPDEGAEYLGTVNGGGFYGFNPVNPGHIFLAKKVDIMGTYQGYSEFNVGNDGMLIGYNDIYYIMQGYDLDSVFDTDKNPPSVYRFGSDSRMLTLKQDFAECKKGDKLFPYMTDLNNYMLFFTPEGEERVFYYDTENADIFDRKIDGIPEEELFDGIFYAG